VSVLQTAEEAADASSEYATRLHAAGNLSDLGLARELALFEEARVARELSEAALIAPRENLRRLLGVEGGATLDTPLILPALPEARVSSEGLEALALTKRLDLQALGKEIEAFEQALSLARFYQWVPFVEVGISAAREVDGGWVVGPQFALEIPIFDQGQAQVARIEAMLRERMRAHEALTLDIRRDVRIQSEAVRAARADRYRATLIPLRERIVRLTNQEYNFMLVGAFELLSAKRDEIATYREYVGALRSYWSSRARLQSALGGLPAPVAALERPIETSSESTEMDHMTHDGNHSPPESEEKRSPGHEHHHEGHQQ
jgi:cobalt-zinc-cadmium efflux system outer membrane protein